jgi:hypothetical protein
MSLSKSVSYCAAVGDNVKLAEHPKALTDAEVDVTREAPADWK